MKKAYILLEDGFEEMEALITVDVLRRAGIEALLVGMKHHEVIGSHGIKVIVDQMFDGELVDLVVLPGGLPGAKNLRDDAVVIDYIQEMDKNNRLIGAICAAPIVLNKAGIIKGKHITSYPSFKDEFADSIYLEHEVVEDNHIITSRGPGTTFAFALTLARCLGIDTRDLEQAMLL